MSEPIAAKPTNYKGIEFRSRLEARYAALFDLLGWTWEYEPEIDGAYIPDFILHGTEGRRVVTEVKNPLVYSKDKRSIIEKAVGAIGSEVDFLILTGEFPPCERNDLVVFGFMPVMEFDYIKEEVQWEEEQALLFRPGIRYGLEYDFAHTWGSWAGRLTGAYEGNALYEGTLQTKKVVLQLWSQAGNAIQWKPE